jgi:hypothetical protein
LPLTLLWMALLANVHSARVFPSLWQCPIQAAEMAAGSVELTCVLTHAMVDLTQVLHAARSGSSAAAAVDSALAEQAADRMSQLVDEPAIAVVHCKLQ